jgi:hypothetical protein
MGRLSGKSLTCFGYPDGYKVDIDTAMIDQELVSFSFA